MLRRCIKNWHNSQLFWEKSHGKTVCRFTNTIWDHYCRYAGEGLTFVDFMMYELIDENLLLVPDCLHSFPNIREHLQRFERLPQVIIIDVLLLLLLFLLLLLLGGRLHAQPRVHEVSHQQQDGGMSCLKNSVKSFRCFD